jgi:hypothetical protein
MRAVVFKDGDAWVAQALEHDICAQAPDLPTLRLRFLATVRAEIEESEQSGRAPLEGIPPAPDRFFKLWDQRSKFVDSSSDEVELALVA